MEKLYIPKEKLQEHISNWGRTGEGMSKGKSELTSAYIKQLKARGKNKYGRRKLFILSRTGEGMSKGKSEVISAYIKQLKARGKNKYGRRKLFILTCAIFSQGTGRALAVERLRTFEKLLEKNFKKIKKIKKIKNKSARF